MNKSKEKPLPITVRLYKKQKAWVLREAKRQQVSTAAVVRQAINDAL